MEATRMTVRLQSLFFLSTLLEEWFYNHRIIVLGTGFVVQQSMAVSIVNGGVHEFRLVRDILAGYDKRVRPSHNFTEVLNVTFGLALAQIIGVDMKNQILTTNCWLNQIWSDVGLKWEPEKYGGIHVVRLPYDEVWRPDIILYNNNVIVTSDGNVTWLSMVILKSSCHINVRYFPFDWQNCSLWFASWTYDGFNVNLITNSEHGDLSNYIPNSEWELVDMIVQRNVRYYSCCQEPYPDITSYIVLKRRPLFYIFNMIFPCILITLVALLGFYIPSDSGEKVTMGITTLLSMTVFMMLVTENMPPTSDVLPLIGIYYGTTIFIVSFATGMTVFTLNIHYKGVKGKEVPHLIRVICFKFLAKLLCMCVDNVPTGTSEPNEITFSARHNLELGDTGDQLSTSCPKGYNDNQLESQSSCHNSCHLCHSHYMNFPPTNSQSTSFSHDIKVTDHTTKLKGSEHGDNPPARPTSPKTLPPLPSPPARLPTARAVDFGVGAESSVINTFESTLIRVLNKVHQTIEMNDRRLLEQDKRDVIKLEWQSVAQIADRVLLFCFVSATVTITCFVLFQSTEI